MSFAIDRDAIKDEPSLGGTPFNLVKSDTAPALTDEGCYPRGFMVLTGGTITVWVSDVTGADITKKRDLPEVPDGFTWTWGGIYGIASTNEAGDATTCADIIGIP